MKTNRIIKLTVAMFAGVTLLAACGSQNSNKQSTNSAQTEKKQSQAEINARGVVAAINHKHPHFKMEERVDQAPNVVETNVGIVDDSADDSTKVKFSKTYGFTDNNKGISTTAFALKNGLNRGQAQMIMVALTNATDKDGDSLVAIEDELSDENKDVTNLSEDYIVINDLNFVKTSKVMKIHGHATAYYHIGSGKEQHRGYTINYIIDKNDKKDDGNSKPIKKSEKKDTLDTDYKNVEVPRGKWIVTLNQLDANL